MSVQYDSSQENWWLSVGHSPVGETYRSMTNKLLFERWLACNVLENARGYTEVTGGTWTPVEVHISKDGEHKSTDVI